MTPRTPNDIYPGASINRAKSYIYRHCSFEELEAFTHRKNIAVKAFLIGGWGRLGALTELE